MGVDQKDNKDEGVTRNYIWVRKETEDLIPAPIYFSHKILRLMADDRKSGKLEGIEPDSKVKLQCL